MCIIGLPVGPRANKVMQAVAEHSLACADYGAVILTNRSRMHNRSSSKLV